MDLGGYTDIPETLPEAQQMIVTLLNEAKRAGEVSAETLRALDMATGMIEALKAEAKTGNYDIYILKPG